MTVSTTTNSITYNGDGSSTVWSFPFPGVAAADLSVTTVVAGVTTTISPSLYTVILNPPVSPNPTSVGGTITYPLSGAPLGVGSTITIARTLPAIQGTSLANQGTMYPTVIEQALDYLTMLAQGLLNAVGFYLRAPSTDPAGLNYTLPAVAQRASQILGFDSLGNLTTILTAPAGVISSAMAPVVSAATLVLARTAFGLGTAAVTNVKLGLQASVSGAGNLDVDFPVVPFTNSGAASSLSHMSFFDVTGTFTMALPRANTLWNGFGFFVFTSGGPVTLVPDLHDNFIGYGSGATLTIPQDTLAYITTNGAATGLWYVTPPRGIGGRVAITGTLAVTNAHNGALLGLGNNACYTVTFPPANTLDPNFRCTIVNEDTTRGKIIAGISDPIRGTSWILYPGQTYTVFNDNNVLYITPSFQRYTGSINIYVDKANGSDTLNDGLVPGAGAFKTIGGAAARLYQDYDLHATSPVTIWVAGGQTYQEDVVFFAMLPLTSGVFIRGYPIHTAFTWQPVGGACLQVGDWGAVGVADVIFDGTGTVGAVAVSMHQDSVFEIHDTGVTFGTFPSGNHIVSDNQGLINLLFNYAISGPSGQHIKGGQGLQILIQGINITFSAATLTTFLSMFGNSTCTVNGFFTTSGTLTAGCIPYSIDGLCVLFHGSLLPGTGAPSSTHGSQVF